MGILNCNINNDGPGDDGECHATLTYDGHDNANGTTVVTLTVLNDSSVNI